MNWDWLGTNLGFLPWYGMTVAFCYIAVRLDRLDRPREYEPVVKVVWARGVCIRGDKLT